VAVLAPRALAESFVKRPIIDMTMFEWYQGFRGGLYENGSNQPPAAHDAEGLARAAGLQPIDGKVVFLAIGLSNSDQELCGRTTAAQLPCDSWTFMGQAASSGAVDHQSLVIVNGASGAQTAETWDEPTDANYARIEKDWLAPLGLTPSQVQVVLMLEMAHRVVDRTSLERATPRLPESNADAFRLVAQYGATARALKSVYPNLKILFVSPRSYGGYGTSADGNANPEPYAYETGWATKFFIRAQTRQCPTSACAGSVDLSTGDLSYADGTAPWITWGAYLWAHGTTANSEGLFYLPEDYDPDGQHPTQSGETKIGGKLLDFFLDSPYSRPWFAADG
jgi:hypothetical protein